VAQIAEVEVVVVMIVVAVEEVVETLKKTVQKSKIPFFSINFQRK
jgi:hypothetical protein